MIYTELQGWGTVLSKGASGQGFGWILYCIAQYLDLDLNFRFQVSGFRFQITDRLISHRALASVIALLATTRTK